VQLLYVRGWGLSPVLPNGSGIAVLRMQFEFASADGLEEFLADLRGYEEKKQSFDIGTLLAPRKGECV